MVLEGSTGFSGAFARQVTLNKESALARPTRDLLNALELSAKEGGIMLLGEGVLIDGGRSTPVTLQFKEGKYFKTDNENKHFTRSQLVLLASEGKFVGTLTARHGAKVGIIVEIIITYTFLRFHRLTLRHCIPICVLCSRNLFQ